MIVLVLGALVFLVACGYIATTFINDRLDLCLREIRDLAARESQFAGLYLRQVDPYYGCSTISQTPLPKEESCQSGES